MNSAATPDIEALRAALAVAEARADEAEAKATRAVAKASSAEAVIAALKLQIEKLRREIYGQRSERKARLLDQLELELEELEASATEGELAAEQATARTSTVKSFTRRRPPSAWPRIIVAVLSPEKSFSTPTTPYGTGAEAIGVASLHESEPIHSMASNASSIPRATEWVCPDLATPGLNAHKAMEFG